MAELESLLPYDTGLMREVAQALRKQAGAFGQVADEISGSAGGLVFDAPAGRRIKSGLGGCTRAVTAAAHQLDDAAGKVFASADDVDRQNAAIQAHNNTVLSQLTPIERKLVENNL